MLSLALAAALATFLTPAAALADDAQSTDEQAQITTNEQAQGSTSAESDAQDTPEGQKPSAQSDTPEQLQLTDVQSLETPALATPRMSISIDKPNDTPEVIPMREELTTWGQKGTTLQFIAEGNVTIDARVEVWGDVHLTLADGANLICTGGIHVGEGNSLTIDGQANNTGTLTATDKDNNAGIGGNAFANSGTVTINGGTVNAKGGASGAGLGGGVSGEEDPGSCSVIINGGIVNATGGSAGAGIGSGADGNGNVAITGGTINAMGGFCGAGIGGGMNGNGTVTITGGTVTAKTDGNATGIGGGCNGNGYVTISGGTVNATGRDGHAGIGGGNGSVIIDGNAFVVANGDRGKSGIDVKTNQNSWRGVVVENGSGKVYGNVALTTDATLPSGSTLTVPAGSSLTVPAGVTFTNNGTVNVELDGTFNTESALAGGGKVTYLKSNPSTEPVYVIRSTARSMELDDGAAVSAASAATEVQEQPEKQEKAQEKESSSASGNSAAKSTGSTLPGDVPLAQESTGGIPLVGIFIAVGVFIAAGLFIAAAKKRSAKN
ncbi:MAG: hypothetical protein Q4C41_00630 [Eggerthellaceae bacterium]|nr:hypothetical protein [Eggerthellaceae bacterium]